MAKKPVDHTAEAPEPKFERPGHLVRRLHQICVSVFLDAAKDLNLTSVQYATLVGIQDRPGIDQITLGRCIALDRQTVSNVVNRLHLRGLVERKNKDKRTKALFVTEAGSTVIQEMGRRAAAVDETILAPLTQRQRADFMSNLLKLVNSNNSLSRAPMKMPDQDN